MNKKTLVLVLVMLLASCGSPAPKFYQPIALKTAELDYPKFKKTILIQPIILDAETSRPQITTTGQKDFELKIDEFNRWGAAPDKLIQRVIAQNLATYFPNADIESQTPLRKNYAYAVAVEISEMSGRLDDFAALEAVYFIKNSNGKIIKSGKISERVAIEGGYDVYIPAQSRLLGAMSAQIAADISEL